MVSRFGAYEILHELKSGGMGAVLLGRKRGPGAFEQLVAIKTIRPEYATTPAVRAMFLDEAAILSRLTHPGIATVHDFGEHDGSLYMVMEYVAGNSFRALVDPVPPPMIAARAIAEACRGLHAAHEVRDTSGALLGVVHRDISPDNLMLGFDGHVKVIDFGIALVKNRQAPVTEFGTVKGKPPYMSPEQVANEPMDRRSDVFSIAVVLHEMLAGQQLFDGDSIYAIALAVQQKEIPPPSLVRGEPLPPGLDAAVMRALARDPDQRTPTAAQLAEELEHVITAAAGETLEAWADRELAGPRAAHRAWLAKVTGAGSAARSIGRATGAATQLAAIVAPGLDDDAPAVPVVSPPPPEDDDDDELPVAASGGRRALLLGSALLLVALGGTAAYLALRERAAAPAAVRDAPPPVDATELVDAGPADAAVADAAVVIDAPAAIDAAGPVDAPSRPPRDARRPPPPVDAGTRPPPADAPRPTPPADAAVRAAAGFGIVNIRARRGTYAQVTLDGAPLGPTPILKRKIPAGPHTVELIPPVGEDVYRITFELVDGETKNITQP